MATNLSYPIYAPIGYFHSQESQFPKSLLSHEPDTEHSIYLSSFILLILVTIIVNH